MNDELDLGDNLKITKTTARKVGGGTQISGTLHGHRFDALVFRDHAETPEYELGDSRISKLWIQRLANRQTTFNWDRGPDQPVADDATQTIVDFLAAGLAEHVYGK